MSNQLDYNPHLGYLDEILVQHTRLIHSIAKRYRNLCNSIVGYDDLISEGTIGMIKAFHRYDPTGFDGTVTKFSTFAVPTIKGNILAFLRDKSLIAKPPRSIYETANKIRTLNLEDKSSDHVARKLEISTKLAANSLHYLKTSGGAYLDQAVYSDDSGEITLLDSLGRYDDFSRITVEEFQGFLSEKEQEILNHRIQGKSQGDIGEIIGKSQVQVSRILDQIKLRLQKYMDNPESEEFKVKNEVTTRKVNLEETKKYDIKTVMNGIEWFEDNKLPSTPTVGLNTNGMIINSAAAKILNCAVGHHIKVGYNSEFQRLVLLKDETGNRLRRVSKSSRSVNIINKRLADWLYQKGIKQDKYVLQYDETAKVHFIQLEAIELKAATA
ncbi:sigma-70 family RNA polymerase sigma factor [Paenibacillus sp. FSL K6-2524]|uniref:sigma-70 family RNA polymerase sigma factor n=1 Tax=Paenibacillus sp. FSL K6-2524 TaxID=2954516 RepID=UPI0030F7A700